MKNNKEIESARKLLNGYYNYLMDEFNGHASEQAIGLFIEREFGRNGENNESIKPLLNDNLNIEDSYRYHTLCARATLYPNKSIEEVRAIIEETINVWKKSNINTDVRNNTDNINTDKILNVWDRICLFCGEQEKPHYDEYDKYYACDCNDAIKTKEIKNQIEVLERSLPLPKYEITQELVLHYNK